MRSFGGGSRGMGGGSGGSSGGSVQMLRTVQRAVRAGVGGAAQEPFSNTHPSTNTTVNNTHRARQTSASNNNKKQPITLSSSSSSTSSVFSPHNNLPISASSTAPAPAWPTCSSPTFTDDSDWECIDGCEDDRAQAFYDDFVFGSVPSRDEVHHAVFALQESLNPLSSPYLIKERPAHNLDMDLADQVSSPTGSMHRASPFGTKLDWMEPPLQLCNPSMLRAHGSDRVYEAFNLLRNEPSVQRMVVSLSSDKAVWDAVLKNEAVRELRDSLNQDDDSSEKSDEGSDTSDAATDFLSWIIANTKAKVMQLIDKITQLVNGIFHIQEGEKTADGKADPLEEKLRASFFLSIVVMLIVVMTRSSKPC